MHEVDIGVSFYRKRPRGPTVLVVDDDPDVVAILRESLQRLGYRVIGARDGMDAMERLAAADGTSRIDLLVTDLSMPRASGFDVIRCVTAQPPAPAVIVVSAFVDRTLRAEAKQLGAHSVFEKPFQLDDLLRLVQRLTPTTPARTC